MEARRMEATGRVKERRIEVWWRSIKKDGGKQKDEKQQNKDDEEHKNEGDTEDKRQKERKWCKWFTKF